MASNDRWLSALWPTVQRHLPPPPATVVELGCGRLGGFVPRLGRDGYEAVGIDPAAPDGEEYRQIQFEDGELPAQLDAVIACTSLHHVSDPAEVVEKMATALAPGGVAIVVEWDWESMDDATARWCFDRAPADGWIQRRHEGWEASGQPWQSYLHAWASEHGIHSAHRLLSELDERFERASCDRGPFFFADLDGTSEADELEAISSGAIAPGRVDYVGRLARATAAQAKR
jgi:SAM-dependent methyltransferase